MLRNYIRSSYGAFLAEPYMKAESFYAALVEEARPYVAGAAALDAGCALGRLVFEYEKMGAGRACGNDTSRQFIGFCESLKKGERKDIGFAALAGSNAVHLRGRGEELLRARNV